MRYSILGTLVIGLSTAGPVAGQYPARTPVAYAPGSPAQVPHATMTWPALPSGANAIPPGVPGWYPPPVIMPAASRQPIMHALPQPTLLQVQAATAPPEFVPPSASFGPPQPPVALAPGSPPSAPVPDVRGKGATAPLPNPSPETPAIPKSPDTFKAPPPLPVDDPKTLKKPAAPAIPDGPTAGAESPSPIQPGMPLVASPDELDAWLPSHENNPPYVAPRGYRVYGYADYWFLWTKKQHVPPLLTTPGFPGSGSRIILSDLSFDNQERTAGHMTVGKWLDPGQTIGVELGGFWMAERSPDFRANEPLLARPYSLTPILTAATQQIRVEPLQRFWSGEGNGRFELCRDTYYHFDLLGGFRYLELDEGLQITDRFTLPGPSGDSLVRSDRFGARNQFYGGQLGSELEVHCGRWFFDLSGKIALGSNYEVVNIGGTTVTTRSGSATSVMGGLLARPSNIGRYSRQEFVAVPEISVALGVQLTTHLRASVGYALVYVNSVVRPGDQIVLPAVGPPRFDFRDTDFWAQGITLGMEFRY